MSKTEEQFAQEAFEKNLALTKQLNPGVEIGLAKIGWTDEAREAAQEAKKFKTLAGTVKIGTKAPEEMTNAELQSEHEKITLHSSAVGRQMINEGRGMEKPSDRVNATDDLSVADRALNERASALRDEASYRNKMGGRRVVSEDGRVSFKGKMPGSLKHGYYEG